MLIDTHAHINFPDFDEDRETVIKDCLAKDIWMINVGTDYKTSEEVVNLSGKYPRGLYAAVGIHPEHMEEETFDPEAYKKLILSQGKGKVVALGEIGLDYWQKPKTKRKTEIFKAGQKNLFLPQLEMAQKMELPVIIHCRKAHQELISLLEAVRKPGQDYQGVIHCFTGDWSMAQQYLAMGFYLGFNGIIFKMDLRETIRKIPQERMLIETDCPFLIPPSAKEENKERNDPRCLSYIVKTIARERGADFETIARETTDNAKKLFKLA